MEETTVAIHETGAEVKENNLEILYNRRVRPITVDDDDVVFISDMERDINITDEHMISIIDLTTYMLLSKIDAQIFLIEAKKDIEWGNSDITGGLFISNAFNWQTSNSGATM